MAGATTASSVATTVLTGIGAATGVAAAIDSTISAVTSAFKEIAPQKFPIANALHGYATYDYVIGIGSLTAEDCNYPDSTYLAGKRIPLICKSANADPNNRVNTPYGKFDFFVEDLQLDSQIGLQFGFNTNVSSISFKVREPFSMGLFMISIQQAAQEQGWNAWRDAPFLLTIDFRGNKENGSMVPIPGLEKRIPFMFNEINMSVDASGSSYTVTAQPYNQLGLSDEHATLKTDVSIKGTTVQETLQTGEKSLQTVVNKRLKTLQDKKIVSVPDEILILFPIDTSSEASGGGSGNTENKDGATTDATQQALFDKIGVSRNKDTQSLEQDPKNCNDLGKAKLGFDEKRKGDAPVGKDNVIYDDKLKVNVRANNTINAAESDFRFRQDTDIPNAINQVILQSNFVTDAFNPDNLSPEGYIGWWRIDVQTYIIPNTDNMKSTGSYPKLIVYRVVPYDVHSSKMAPPNAQVPGFDNLAMQAVKEYNYIYTGKNVDILNFDIKINNGFQTIMAADGLEDGGDVKDSEIGNVKPKGGSPLAEGFAPEQELGVGSTIVKYIGTLTGSDKMGGGGTETKGTRAARFFMDSVTSGLDMYNIKLKIVGDPYFVVQSGMGNYTASSTQYSNLTSDGSVNYQNGEVVISIFFRTPIDINQTTGMYSFGSATAPLMQFNGLYNVTTVKSTFSGGQFTQELDAYRLPMQEGTNVAPSGTFNIANLASGVVDAAAKIAGDAVGAVTDAVTSVVSKVL